MTQFAPVWQVKIGGTDYTAAILANLSITSGRTNIYTQPYAGYCNIELIFLAQDAITFGINDSISVSIKNTAGVFTPIFGGSIVDLGISIREAGSVLFTQTVTILALGALSRLPKQTTQGVLAKDYDGTQIYNVLKNVLLNSWEKVPAALTWATYTPATETWANAQNTGLGEIDQPGDYELAARSSSVTDIYSLVAALATSGLGYLYENAQGQISYADSTHRSQYLAANGYVDLSANEALASGISLITRAGDVRNSIVLKYDATSSSQKTASDADSIATYGTLGQIISTTLHNASDAQYQADFYLTLRAYPQANFNAITYELTNPELDNGDRDALISVFMGMPIRISDLPLNMNSGQYSGFVEGWTFTAQYNRLTVTLTASPTSFSLQSMKWSDVPAMETWSSVSPTLDWEHATLVA